MIMAFPEFYKAATKRLTTPNEPPPQGILVGGLNYYHLEATAKHRPITMMDVRCDYLRQIKLLELQGGISDVLIKHAYLSAYTAPIKVSVQDMLCSAQQELTLLLQNPDNLMSVLASPLMAEHGLLNTVAIKLQDPNATQLLSPQQVKKLGLTVQQGWSPILMLVPTLQKYFRREDGEIAKCNAATQWESVAIAKGEIAIESNVQYTLKQYYDVEQLRLSARDRLRLQEQSIPREIGQEELLDFANQLQDASGARLRVELTPHDMPVRSLYDAQSCTIFVKAQLSERHMLWEVTKRICEAMTEMTSTATQPVKDFESRLMAVQLSHKWAIHPPSSVVTEISEAFYASPTTIGNNIEAVTCRVGNAVQFVSQHFNEAMLVHEQFQELENSQRQDNTLQPKGNSEVLGNFLEGIK